MHAALIRATLDLHEPGKAWHQAATSSNTLHTYQGGQREREGEREGGREGERGRVSVWVCV